MYIDPGMKIFERLFPGENQLICIRYGEGAEFDLKYVRTKARTEFYVPDRKAAEACLQQWPVADLYVFHGIDPLQAWFVLALPPDAKILWLYLGFEVYCKLPEFIDGLYAEQTCQMMGNRQNSAKTVMRRWWLNYYLSFVPGKSRRRFRNAPVSPSDFRRALQRAKWVGSCLPEDWDFIVRKAHLPNRLVWMTYYSIQDTVGDAVWSQRVSGDGIWIGNSATPENNHADVLVALSKMDVGCRKLICPLSYGSSHYAEQVIALGTSKFGNAFMPLRQYMPRQEYNALMLQTPIVIMNHWRQQALGNILTSLWLGAHVFLSCKNPLLAYLQKQGFIISIIEEDLTASNPEALTPLSEHAVEHNQKLLLREFSQEVVLQRMQAGISALLR